jgi:hypothetical protein
MKIIMKTLNNFHIKYKDMVRNITTGIIALCFLLTACSPQEDDSYKLGGSQVEIPQNVKITAVDNDNEVVITFDPMTIIDGDDVLAVQFSSAEAGINFTVKDASTTVLKKKVYRSGEYTLYVAAITRAGTGTPREIPFTVAKNLLLETLSESVLPEVVKYNIDATHQETFYKNELYIEENSIITLAGAIGNDDAVVNLDFFVRESTTTAKFVGKSGVYSIYWNPVRKNVIVEPITAIEAPNYYVFTGVGIGYPTTVSSEDIKAAYGAGDGRYTTEWDPGKNIRSRVVMRSTGDNTYQATICINEGAAFKPFSNTGWAGEIKTAAATFTGSDIIDKTKENDWVPNNNMDKNAYYRITLNSSTKAVDIKRVSATGEVLEDVEIDPNAPIESSVFSIANAKSQEIAGEAILSMYHTLKKGDEYTPNGGLAKALFNVDFFEKVAGGKLKFLGEDGDYRLLYNPIRNNVIVSVDEHQPNDYMFIAGVGLGYPTKVSAAIISSVYSDKGIATLENWGFANVMEFILMRKVSDNVYQATVMMPFEKKYWGEGPYASFKVYTATSAEAANEKGAKFFSEAGGITGTATGIVAEILDIPEDNNMDIFAKLPAATLRITVDMNAKSMKVDNIVLP